jgi:hypothetical protein
MIYVTGFIIFVGVKRMHARVDGPAGAAREARVLIRELRDLPGNDVAILELWILSSHATWQHFRILPDRIIEIRPDGTVSGEVERTDTRTDPARPAGVQAPAAPAATPAKTPTKTPARKKAVPDRKETGDSSLVPGTDTSPAIPVEVASPEPETDAPARAPVEPLPIPLPDSAGSGK